MEAKSPVPEAIEAVVFSADEIAAAVRRLAAAIAADLAGEPVRLLGVLKGAMFLVADLARELPAGLEVGIDFLAVASYGAADRSSGEIRLVKDMAESIEGKNVVIVEDVVDGGRTLQYLQRMLAARKPATLRTCALLDKPYRRAADVPIDYRGLAAPDAFVVGYGLDYQENYRHLPYLARLRPWVFKR